MKDRYSLFPMLDGWTDVFQVPGKRTTGTRRADLCDHRSGMEGYAADWRQGVQVADQHRLAARSHLLHRHARGLRGGSRASRPVQAGATERLRQGLYAARRERSILLIDMKTPVRDQVNAMDAMAYFTLLAQFMKTNPPAAADAPELAKFANIGLVAGQDFDASKLNADFVKRIPEVAFDRIMLQFKVDKVSQGHQRLGLYDQDGTLWNRLFHAGLRHRHRPRCQPASRCRLSHVAEGCRWPCAYDGANKYVMHFRKGQLPPVDGFWSMTMYDSELLFRRQSDQPLFDQSRGKTLKTNADGSTDLYIQNQIAGGPIRNATGSPPLPASSS